MRWSASQRAADGKHVSIVWDSDTGDATIITEYTTHRYGAPEVTQVAVCLPGEAFQTMMRAIGMWPIGRPMAIDRAYDPAPGYADMHGTSECHRRQGRASLCRLFGVPVVTGDEAIIAGNCPGCGGEVRR